MERLFRIDFYPQDWLIGTSNLEPEECGMYIQICALIYAQRGPIINDPEELSRKLKNCSIRKARALVERLVAKEKIFVIEGKLSQKRAESELNLKRTHLEVSAKGGRTKHENASASKENKHLTSTERPVSVSTSTATATAIATPREDTKVSSKPPLPPLKNSGKDEVKEAFDLYNDLASRIGLPTAQVLNAVRSGRLKARLRDCGGIEGWKAALERVEASDFCAGRAKDFKASLDFLLQESSFTKLMEGNYDNGNKPAPGGTAGRPAYDAGMEGFSRAADRHARERGREMGEGGCAPGDIFAQNKGGQSS